MTMKERHSAILDLAKTNNIVFIGELAQLFDISLETARRDLEALQDEGYVRRIHGGAVLSDTFPSTPLSLAENNGQQHKSCIGRIASSLVNDGDTIFLAEGSTVQEMSSFLKTKKELTVITNSILVVNELINTDIKVIILGGLLIPNEEMVYSHATEKMLEQYYVDKTFFSCGGISACDITDYGDALDRYSLAKHSRKMILLADSDKFGRTAKFKTCDFETIDTLVVDDQIDSSYLDLLKNQNVNVIMAQTNVKK